MTISSLHRILLAFDRNDESSPGETVTSVIESIGKIGGEALKPKSSSTAKFFETGILPFDATIRMGNDYLDSLSPEASSWIWLRSISDGKLRTKFVSISTVLLYTPSNFQTQWKISRQIIDLSRSAMPIRYALANAKDIDDEHFSALPDIAELDIDPKLKYAAPITFVRISDISNIFESIIGCFTDDQKISEVDGVLIDFSSISSKESVDQIARCVKERSRNEVTLLLPQLLITEG